MKVLVRFLFNRLNISIGILIIFSQVVFSQTEEPGILHGCTSFTLIIGSNLIFGRNLDVDSDIGNIFINPKGLNKTGYFDSTSTEMPAK